MTDPTSPDDPCRYLTALLRDDIVSNANATSPNPDVADIPCKQAIRDNERARENPLYTGPQGVSSIRFLSSLILTEDRAGRASGRRCHMAAGVRTGQPVATGDVVDRATREMACLPLLPVAVVRIRDEISQREVPGSTVVMGGARCPSTATASDPRGNREPATASARRSGARGRRASRVRRRPAHGPPS